MLKMLGRFERMLKDASESREKAKRIEAYANVELYAGSHGWTLGAGEAARMAAYLVDNPDWSRPLSENIENARMAAAH